MMINFQEIMLENKIKMDENDKNIENPVKLDKNVKIGHKSAEKVVKSQ